MGKCSVCKEEQYGSPRHKAGRSGVHYVICERCLRAQSYVPGRSMLSGVFSFFRDIWGFIVATVSAPFKKLSKQVEKREQYGARSRAGVYKMRASQIPRNPSSVNPQART